MPDLASPLSPADAAEAFGMLACPTRLAIMAALADGPRCVGDLVAALGASRALVSHHLIILRAGRLVAAERRGKFVSYSARPDALRACAAYLATLAGEGGGSHA